MKDEHITPIKVLDDSVRTQIAAGQVVERPLSVLKELLENALDAGASEITIRLRKGGLEEIQVTDNGCGIPSEQLLLAVAPHATSKISSLADLSSVASFGFRGEALASIRAAAALELQSRVAVEKVGVQLSADSDTTEPVGMSPGTRVTVRDLFRSHPARKKFLRTATVEYRHCLQYVEQLAITQPAVTFKLFHNDKLILNCPTTTQLKRIEQVWGESHADTALPLLHNSGLYTFAGMICKPETARESSAYQVLTINNRLVKHPKIATQIKQAFGTLLAVKKHPSFVLSLQLPYELVDINVDPRKETVTLAEEKLVLEQLHAATQSLLAAHNLSFGAENSVRYPYSMDMGLAEYFHTQTKLWSVKDLQDEQILQIDNVYLFAQSEKGVLVVDQHAAHESILYAQLTDAWKAEQENPQPQQLAQPIELQLTQSELAVIEEHSTTLTELGIVFEQNQNTLTLTALPAYLQTADIHALIQELITALQSEQQNYTSEIVHRTLAYVACRAAIKAGEALTQTERINLLQKLEETDNTYTCPHGRPVAVLLSSQQLAQLFERE